MEVDIRAKYKYKQKYALNVSIQVSDTNRCNGICDSICSWPLWAYAIACIFVNIHGLNIYFWLSFIPAINAFEMATFLWSLWGFEQRSCFMKNHVMIAFRLISGVLVQFWCSSITVPLNVIVTQMGSRFKKALVAESVRESLHSWCKRVKAKSKRDSLHSHTTRSVCSLESIADDDGRDAVTVGTLSRSSSMESLNQITVTSVDSLNQMTITSSEQAAAILGTSNAAQGDVSSRVEEYLSDTIKISASEPLNMDEEDYGGIAEEAKVDTLYDLFQRT
ncbi:hypothetical protein GQ457_04G000570 [Hibiscus cannabinus]